MRLRDTIYCEAYVLKKGMRKIEVFVRKMHCCSIVSLE